MTESRAMTAYQCSACATPCLPHPLITGALALGCDCDDSDFLDLDRPRPVLPDTATLSRIGGVWQLRATRLGGSARLSVDTDLDDAFDKLRAFLGGS